MCQGDSCVPATADCMVVRIVDRALSVIWSNIKAPVVRTDLLTDRLSH